MLTPCAVKLAQDLSRGFHRVRRCSHPTKHLACCRQLLLQQPELHARFVAVFSERVCGLKLHRGQQLSQTVGCIMKFHRTMMPERGDSRPQNMPLRKLLSSGLLCLVCGFPLRLLCCELLDVSPLIQAAADKTAQVALGANVDRKLGRILEPELAREEVEAFAEADATHVRVHERGYTRYHIDSIEVLEVRRTEEDVVRTRHVAQYQWVQAEGAQAELSEGRGALKVTRAPEDPRLKVP